MFILLYTFLVIYFTWYKENVNWWISFDKFSDVSTAFIFAGTVGNLWSIYLRINILSCLWSETLATQATRAKFGGFSFSWVCFFTGDIGLSKPWRNFSLPLGSLCAFSKVNVFSFLFRVYDLIDSLNLSISFLNFICSSSPSPSVQIYFSKDLVVLNF